MSNHKWSEDEVDFLVRLYRSYECLWNVNRPFYTNTKVRDAAFANIEVKMLQVKKIQGLGPEQIKAKILNLRRDYYKIRRKYENSPFCPSERAGKWYLEMDHMEKCCMQNRNASKKSLPLLRAEPGSEASSSAFSQSDGNSRNEEIDREFHFKSSSLVKFDSRIEIMNVLKKLYISKVTQSYKIVFDILNKVLQNNDRSLVSEESCAHEMSKLGFMYRETIDGKKIIIEDAELRFERFIYLTKIRQFRAINKPIIYIDERIINFRLKYEKLDSREGCMAKPDSSIMFLAITKDGVLSNLFSSQATEADFNKWITDILLSLITVPSVIVMDNSAIHGKLEGTCHISRYSTKNEMLKWLIDNKIPCSPKIARPQLFELIRQNRRETMEYKIDRIIRSHGHEVLRLPQTFSDLNMTDIFWNAVTDPNSTNMLRKATSDNYDLQVLQILFIENILPTISTEKWLEMEKTLIMMENDVFEIDTAIESILETYIFM